MVQLESMVKCKHGPPSQRNYKKQKEKKNKTCRNVNIQLTSHKTEHTFCMPHKFTCTRKTKQTWHKSHNVLTLAISIIRDKDHTLLPCSTLQCLHVCFFYFYFDAFKLPQAVSCTYYILVQDIQAAAPVVLKAFNHAVWFTSVRDTGPIGGPASLHPAQCLVQRPTSSAALPPPEGAVMDTCPPGKNITG